jgi:hypothetical protein
MTTSLLQIDAKKATEPKMKLAIPGCQIVTYPQDAIGIYLSIPSTFPCHRSCDLILHMLLLPH